MGNCSSTPAVVESSAAKQPSTQGRPETLKTVHESVGSDASSPRTQASGISSSNFTEEAKGSTRASVVGRPDQEQSNASAKDSVQGDASSSQSAPSPKSPSRVRFQDDAPERRESLLEGSSNRGDLSSRPLPVVPYVLTQDTKGMLKIKQTAKFAAYCLPSPNRNGSTGIVLSSHGRPGIGARQASRKVNYLRNTLKKLSMMDLHLEEDQLMSPTPTAKSPGAPSPRPMTRTDNQAGLLSLDNDSATKQCDMCSADQQLGVACLCQHFVCTQCFCSHVSEVSTQPELLRKHDFAIFCPVAGCKSLPWNSFHVRKLLDGPSLQGYLDALVGVCRQGPGTPGRGASVIRGAEGPKYLVETVEVLREQLRRLNQTPGEYIPLQDIRDELQTIFDKINNDLPHDEKRMDYLLECMENNPVYRAEKQELARQWRADMAVFTAECLATMRGYVPPHISEASVQSLVEKDGLSKDLAKRLLDKKCLWLVRMRVVDVEKLHEADLFNKFNPLAQKLDIVELAAIFASVPEVFAFDPTGRKGKWRQDLENALRDMDRKRQTGNLLPSEARNPCYKRQAVAPFIHRQTMKRVDFVRSSMTSE